MRKIFLTVFYSGLSPKAPGTAGSLISLLIGILLLQFISLASLFYLSVLITLIAIREIDVYEKEVKAHDSKEIVIDELVGVWLALIFCNINKENMIPLAILCFVYFRIFDIWKPSFIGTIDEKVKGGLGVMGDDILAGIIAGIASLATYRIFLYLMQYFAH